jgi:cation transport ATPase
MSHPPEGAAPPVAWWAFAPLRNALIAALLAGAVFGLDRGGVISSGVAIGGFVVAILLGGSHWASEGVEDLLRERKVGIEVLMLAATIGAAVLGMWDEAAALVVLYGAAEGLEEYVYGCVSFPRRWRSAEKRGV